MKPGTRTLGFADSYAPEADTSTFAGVIVRADRVFDGVAFGCMTVSGLDSTANITDCIRRLDRPDVQYVLVSGIAPAWYNVIDLPRLSGAVDLPVVSVSFEESEGLEPALREAFSGDALTERLACYERQPPRRAIGVHDEQVFVRSVGLDADETTRVVRAFTPDGGRPEPLRVARIAARAGDRLRRMKWDEG